MVYKLSCLFNLFSLVTIIYNFTYHELFVSNILNNNLHYDFLLGVVLSVVGGVKEATTVLTDNTIMWISVGILIILFQVQRFGTDKIGYSFASVLTIWFLFIGTIGMYNFVKHDPGVIEVVNPMYIVEYLTRNKKNAQISLGGVILCLTGVYHNLISLFEHFEI